MEPPRDCLILQIFKRITLAQVESAHAKVEYAHAAAAIAEARARLDTDVRISISDLIDELDRCSIKITRCEHKLNSAKAEFTELLAQYLINERLIDKFAELMRQL